MTQDSESKALTLYPDESEWKLIGNVAKTVYASKRFKDVPSEAVAATVILTGRELGLGPIYSLQRIHFIQGNTGIDGQAMLAMIYRSKKIAVSWDSDSKGDWQSCTMKRLDIPDSKPLTVKWDNAKVTQAGLAAKDNHKHYPEQLKRWRATVDCARLIAPDIIGGLAFVDEIGGVTDDSGNFTGQVYDQQIVDGDFTEVVDGNEPASTPSPVSTTESVSSPKPVSTATNVSNTTPVSTENAIAQENLKKLAQQARIMFSQRLTALKTAAGIESISADQQGEIAYKYCEYIGIPNLKKPFHLSDYTETDINKFMNSLRDGGILPTLTGIWTEMTAVNTPSTVEPKLEVETEEPAKTEPKDSLDSVKKGCNEIKDRLEEAYQFAGVALYIKILNKHGANKKEATIDNWTSVRKELTDVFVELSTGTPIKEVTSRY